MYRINLKIYNMASINLYTTFENIKNIFSDYNCSIKRTIPISSISISSIENQAISYEKDSIIIEKFDKKHMKYDREKNIAFIFAKEEEIRFLDLVYIILPMFSNVLQRENKYLIHSSALKYNDDSSILLVGNANSGKTSLAYELIDKYDFKLISNDHSIIGIEDNRIKIYAGTKEIQMRVGAIKLYFPELYKKVLSENLVNISKDIWDQKIIINKYLNSDNISSYENDYSTVTDMYSLDICNDGNTYIRKKEPIDQLLFIYENISRIIKGTYNYITGFNYPMPSIENEEILQKLANNCKLMMENCNIYEGKGDIDAFSKKLVKKYGK